jgi:hypothetical protein
MPISAISSISTAALKGSTEDAQFFEEKKAA